MFEGTTLTPERNTPAPQPVWHGHHLANPHAAADKATRVRNMFAAIAPSYDLNNRVHSLWLDQSWRRAAVKMATLKPGDRVVDVACGTGDLTLAFDRALARLSRSTQNATVSQQQSLSRVVGIDFTLPMLPLAQKKTHSQSSGDPTSPRYVNGDAMNLPLPDACCDVVSIAFGIRNVADPARAMREFFRVLKPGGRLIVLEFSLPTNRAMLSLYQFYFRQIMTRTATWIARDRTGAYRYLPQSVSTFIDRRQMLDMMKQTGFVEPAIKPLSLGIAVVYRGVKK